MKQGIAWLLCAVLSVSAGLSQDLREQAAQAWERAQEENAAFRTLPSDRKSRSEYLRVIHLYERVYLTTPHSGYSDDALINIATLYEEMGSTSDAVRTLRFLVSDYPASKHVPDARNRIVRLTEGVPSPAASAPVAETDKPSAEGRVSVDGIRYWEEQGSLRVVVDLNGQARFTRGSVENPPRVYVDIGNASLGAQIGPHQLDVNSPMLRGIRIAQNDPDTVRVVLDLEELRNIDTFTLSDPSRLVIDVLGQAVASVSSRSSTRAPAVDAGGEARTEPAEEPKIAEQPALPTEDGDLTLSRSLGLKARRVVIDPGHGGHDPGTIGPSGLSEAELVLDVAKRLRKRIQEDLPGTEVLLTREDDTYVGLEARPLVANQAGADLFISIHANSSRTQSIRGFETFFLNVTGSQDALEIAARENAASERPLSDMPNILNQIMLQEWADESREFAAHIQKALASRSDLGRDRGVKQAPLVVLLGANMPSILAEISFISNPEDERLLKGDARRQQIADALFEGVRSYFGTLGGFRTAEARD